MNTLVLFTAEWSGFISSAFSYEDSDIDVLSRYRQDMVENTSEKAREKS